jgi:hypothetical protein
VVSYTGVVQTLCSSTLTSIQCFSPSNMHLISYVVQCSLLETKKCDVIILALLYDVGLVIVTVFLTKTVSVDRAQKGCLFLLLFFTSEAFHLCSEFAIRTIISLSH